MVRLDFFSTHTSKEKSEGQNETPLNSRVFRPLLRLQLPLRRCRRSKERSFCRLDERRSELERGKAPRARAEARAGSKVSSGSGSGSEIPVSSLLLVSPKQDRQTSQMSRLREYSPTWAHAACPEERREPETSFSRGAFLLAFSFFFLGAADCCG